MHALAWLIAPRRTCKYSVWNSGNCIQRLSVLGRRGRHPPGFQPALRRTQDTCDHLGRNLERLCDF